MTTQTGYTHEVHTRFYALDRDEDISGISGSGRIAYAIDIAGEHGVLLVWDTNWVTVDWRPDMTVLEAIHGHNGATRITPLEPGVDEAAIERARDLLRQVRGRAASTLHIAELIA